MTQLLLTLAQSIKGATTAATDASDEAIVQSTVAAYNEMIAKTTMIPTTPDNDDEVSFTSSSSTTTNEDNDDGSSDMLQLVIAGSKRLMNGVPGRQRNDWDTQWSSGEHIFSLVVREIGLTKFHTKNPRRVKLVANLVDVDDCPENDEDDEYDWTDGVKDAAEACRRTLCQKQRPPIERAVVVIPMLGLHDEQQRKHVLKTARDVVMNCWQGRNNGFHNPLQHTSISCILAC